MAGSVVVQREPGNPRKLLSDLVMAWAQDADTGEPRYILELGQDRRGAKCRCTCVGCGEPLTAVNAAKSEFQIRPHFRHPEGVDHASCLVLAARAAAVRQLQEDGWVELPRRRISTRLVGLSGEFYEAWVEQPPEKLRITNVHYRDRAAAVFTFEDGRSLNVELTGSPAQSEQDVDVPGASIVIEVDDPDIAAMDPESVRSKLRLLPDALCWRSHWSDARMMQDVHQRATDDALLHLDEVPAGLDLPADMDPALKRESLLHLEAKRILVEAGRISVPEFTLHIAVGVGAEQLSADWHLPEDVLKLEQIELEVPYADLIPDLTCKAYPIDGGRVFMPTFLEITVTNAIDEERRSRICDKKQLALEIDLSRAGGRVTRDELRRLIVNELATKRWIYHPEVEEQRQALTRQLEARARRHSEVLATPVHVIAADFLKALTAWLLRLKHLEERAEPEGPIAESPLDEALAEAIDRLRLHGFPEAGDSMLIYPRGILDRILSIQRDEGVGYRLPSGQAVLNAIKQDRRSEHSFHSVYFIAALAYPPKLTASQQAWFDSWREEVRESLRAGEKTYQRRTTYDRLLALLFPEMAAGLAMRGGRAPTVSRDGRSRDTKQPAMFVQNQPRVDTASWRLQDTTPDDWWLKGRDLERWRQQNPKWAAFWATERPAAEKSGE